MSPFSIHPKGETLPQRPCAAECCPTLAKLLPRFPQWDREGGHHGLCVLEYTEGRVNDINNMNAT